MLLLQLVDSKNTFVQDSTQDHLIISGHIFPFVEKPLSYTMLVFKNCYQEKSFRGIYTRHLPKTPFFVINEKAKALLDDR